MKGWRRRVLVLNEDTLEAWGSEAAHASRKGVPVEVVDTCEDAELRLRASPFAYALVAIEKLSDPSREASIVSRLRRAHPRVRVLVRSDRPQLIPDVEVHEGSVTFASDTSWESFASRVEDHFVSTEVAHWRRIPRAAGRLFLWWRGKRRDE